MLPNRRPSPVATITASPADDRATVSPALRAARTEALATRRNVVVQDLPPSSMNKGDNPVAPVGAAGRTAPADSSFSRRGQVLAGDAVVR